MMQQDTHLKAVAPVPPSSLAGRLDRFEIFTKAYHELIWLQTPKKRIPEPKLRDLQRQCVEAESAACAGCPEFNDLEANNKIEELLDRGALGEVIRFVGRVGSFSAPEIWATGGGQHQVYRVTFEDNEGRDLQSWTVSCQATWALPSVN